MSQILSAGGCFCRVLWRSAAHRLYRAPSSTWLGISKVLPDDNWTSTKHWLVRSLEQETTELRHISTWCVMLPPHHSALTSSVLGLWWSSMCGSFAVPNAEAHGRRLWLLVMRSDTCLVALCTRFSAAPFVGTIWRTSIWFDLIWFDLIWLVFSTYTFHMFCSFLDL